MKMHFRMTRSKKAEKILWKRLKFLGFLLLAFSLLFLGYGLILALEGKKEEIIAVPEGLAVEYIHKENECLAEEILNFFLISMIFAFVGTTCLLTFRRKQARQLLEKQNPKEKSHK